MTSTPPLRHQDPTMFEHPHPIQSREGMFQALNAAPNSYKAKAARALQANIGLAEYAKQAHALADQRDNALISLYRQLSAVEVEVDKMLVLLGADMSLRKIDHETGPDKLYTALDLLGALGGCLPYLVDRLLTAEGALTEITNRQHGSVTEELATSNYGPPITTSTAFNNTFDCTPDIIEAMGEYTGATFPRPPSQRAMRRRNQELQEGI